MYSYDELGNEVNVNVAQCNSQVVPIDMNHLHGTLLLDFDPAPMSIPTMSGFGVALLALLLGGAAVALISRRARTANAIVGTAA